MCVSVQALPIKEGEADEAVLEPTLCVPVAEAAWGDNICGCGQGLCVCVYTCVCACVCVCVCAWVCVTERTDISVTIHAGPAEHVPMSAAIGVIPAALPGTLVLVMVSLQVLCMLTVVNTMSTPTRPLVWSVSFLCLVAVVSAESQTGSAEVAAGFAAVVFMVLVFLLLLTVILF